MPAETPAGRNVWGTIAIFENINEKWGLADNYYLFFIIIDTFIN